MSDIEQRIIEAMTEFANNLESGVPIEATRIRRVDTPDGPMHQREHVVLNTEPKTIICDEGDEHAE